MFFGGPDEFLGSWGIPLKKIKIPVLVVFTVYWGGGVARRSRQWHPTPVLWPGKSHRQRSLVGCSPWGR